MRARLIAIIRHTPLDALCYMHACYEADWLSFRLDSETHIINEEAAVRLGPAAKRLVGATGIEPVTPTV